MQKTDRLQLDLDRLADDGGPVATSIPSRGGASPWQSLERLGRAAVRFAEALQHTARAEADLVRYRIRSLAIRCLAVVGGGLFVLLTASAAAVFVMIGSMNALTALTPLPDWGSQLIVGLVVIAAAAIFVTQAGSRMRAEMLRLRVESYSRRRRNRSVS